MNKTMNHENLMKYSMSGNTSPSIAPEGRTFVSSWVSHCIHELRSSKKLGPPALHVGASLFSVWFFSAFSDFLSVKQLLSQLEGTFMYFEKILKIDWQNVFLPIIRIEIQIVDKNRCPGSRSLNESGSSWMGNWGKCWPSSTKGIMASKLSSHSKVGEWAKKHESRPQWMDVIPFFFSCWLLSFFFLCMENS